MSSVIRHPSSVTAWLALCTLLVAVMVLVGGYTRLSGSGLSITSWKPVHGIIPPLGDTDWNEEFTAYQQSPQYKVLNSDMSLREFQGIFWPEFIHRLLGRFIGIVFFLPFVIFALWRSISVRFGMRLAGIFALGGVQGLIGWYMVKSGLVDDPHVSHLRLALHLGVAFALFGALLWSTLDVASHQSPVAREKLRETQDRRPATPSVIPVQAGIQRATYARSDMDPGLRGDDGILLYYFFCTLLCVQIILGAFVAGLHGGLIYNTWPTMNGQWVPDGLMTTAPWYHNITAIQFMHRTVALLLPFFFLFWWYSHRSYVKNKRAEWMCLLVSAIMSVQIVLGIVTLLYAAALPLALAHQMTALLLFASSVTLLHRLKNSHELGVTSHEYIPNP